MPDFQRGKWSGAQKTFAPYFAICFFAGAALK
jgi:hypothetical protein